MSEPSTIRIGDHICFSLELLRHLKESEPETIVVTVHDIREDQDHVKTLVLRRDE